MRKPFKAALATLFLSVLAGASNADAGPIDSPGAHKAGLQRLPRLRRQSAQQDRSALAGMDQVYFKQTSHRMRKANGVRQKWNLTRSTF
jgi:hypothetical protein